jgi:hypothetical protein
MAAQRFRCMEGECDRYARVSIDDAKGQRARAWPRHTVAALDGLAGARVVWDKTHGINEHEDRAADRGGAVPAQPERRDCMSVPAAPESSSSTHDGRAAEWPGAVRKSLTTNRRRAVVENPEYAAFARRILKACARRIAAGDIESLTLMAELADTIDSSIRDAVTGLREHGYSWAEIGSRLGVTRQAAQQRWGNRP